MTFVRELRRPDIQLRYEDFDTDEDVPELTEDPIERDREGRVAAAFMSYLSREMEHHCRRDDFEALIVCAESQLLGMFIERLGPGCRRHLVGTVNLDLYNVNETDLISYVRDVLIRTGRRPGGRPGYDHLTHTPAEFENLKRAGQK